MGVRVTFGEWLEDRLQERHWTQAAFAETLGVARPTINGWIHGNPPRRRRLIRDIAKVLDVAENEVLVRAGQPPLDPDYRLPEDRSQTDNGSPAADFDPTDPLLSVSLAYGDKLTPDQKRIVAELIRDMARKEEIER